MFSWVRRSQASRQLAEKELVGHEARGHVRAVFGKLGSCRWSVPASVSKSTHRDDEGLVLVGSGVVAPSSRIRPPMVEEWR